MYWSLLSPLVFLLAAEPAVPPPSFTLNTAAGKSLSGPLKELSEEWDVTLDGKPRTAGAEVISLRRTGLPLPAFPSGPRLLFANGDRLPGHARDLTGERLSFRAILDDGTTRSDIVVPLPAISVLWLAAPASDPQANRLPRLLLNQKRSRDAIRLRNGDTVEGTLTALDHAGFHVDVEQKEVVIERGKVAYVAFNTELMRPPQTKKPYGHLVLANGGRVALASARTKGDVLLTRTLAGPELTVPVEQIAALDLRQGPAVYLSDLKPAAYQETPWTPSLTWPYVADGNVHRRELRLGGVCYDKGLGMHTASRISYPLAGKYRRFEAVVGLDDRDGRDGVVRVQVLVDGKPRDFGWDKDLTARDGPRTVRIDVKGAKELTLVVERGAGGLAERQGCVNWADARLVR